jgi:lysophospholipase L1-like esterase
MTRLRDASIGRTTIGRPAGSDAAAGVAPAAAHSRPNPPGTHYYLALGDSLAQGCQPIDTYAPYYYPDGYVPRVYAALSSDDPKLSTPAHGVRVADVAGAFSVGDGLEAEGTAALNWTWFCSANHQGDVHPNAAAYQVIAQAFLDALHAGCGGSLGGVHERFGRDARSGFDRR